jgi:hypothetical protein
MTAVSAIHVLLFGTNGTNGTSVLLISCVTIGDATNTSSAYSVFRDRLLALSTPRVRPPDAPKLVFSPSPLNQKNTGHVLSLVLAVLALLRLAARVPRPRPAATAVSG